MTYFIITAAISENGRDLIDSDLTTLRRGAPRGVRYTIVGQLVNGDA